MSDRVSAEEICFACKLVEAYFFTLAMPKNKALQLKGHSLCVFCYIVFQHRNRISDAENLRKNIYFIYKAVFALTELLRVFVVSSGYLPTLAIKEAFYKITEHTLKVHCVLISMTFT